MAYDYECSIDFRGDAVKALELIRQRLADKGFDVHPPASNQLHFVNPVSYLNTKKQPLLMVSRGSVTATGTSLVLQVELGNMKALVKFLILLITVMAIPETALLAVVFVMVAKQPALLPLCLLSVVPIPVIGALMPKIQRSLTGRALDELLRDAVANAQ